MQITKTGKYLTRRGDFVFIHTIGNGMVYGVYENGDHCEWLCDGFRYLSRQNKDDIVSFVKTDLRMMMIEKIVQYCFSKHTAGQLLAMSDEELLYTYGSYLPEMNQ